MTNPFTATKAALKVYEKAKATRPTFEAKLEEWKSLTGAEFVAKFNEWEQEERSLEHPVKEAFYQDTKAYNCRDNCMRVDINWIRGIASK